MSKLTIKDNSDSSIIYQVDTSSNPVGVGGMGQVYKGLRIDTKSGVQQEVAIKFLFDDLPPQSIERARREASICIDNENLVRMFGFIETTDVVGNGKTVSHFHVVSEFLRGVMLEDLLKGKVDDAEGKRSPFAESLYLQSKQHPELFAVHFVKSILAGLMALHDKGIIHRDIDPSNIMVTNDGRIKLIDYGIAKRLDDLTTKDRQLTTAGVFMGKAAYASPELVLGDVAHQNETTDIYAIGVILFQLLTGHLPFSGPTSEVLDMQINSAVPVKEIRELAFRKIVAKAMAKKQSDRYGSAAEFRAAIEAVGRRIKPRDVDSEKPIRTDKEKRIRKQFTVAVILAAAMLLLVIGGSFIRRGISREKERTEEALRQEAIAQRTIELDGVMLDSLDPSFSQTDSLTRVVLHSTGFHIQEAINLLKSESTFPQGKEELEKVMAKNYPSSANAYAILASIYSGVGACEVLGLVNNGVNRDYAKAFQLAQKAIELDSGCYYAMFNLGVAYTSTTQNVVPRNVEKGLSLLRQSLDISNKKNDVAFKNYVNRQIN